MMDKITSLPFHRLHFRRRYLRESNIWQSGEYIFRLHLGAGRRPEGGQCVGSHAAASLMLPRKESHFFLPELNER